MKKFSVFICFFLALIFFIGLCADTAQAQVDLSIWTGNWIKVNVKASKGELFSEEGSTNAPVDKLAGGGTFYACVTGVITDTVVSMTVYEYVDKNALLVGNGTIQWYAGSNTNWAGLATLAIDVVPEDPDVYVTVGVAVQGTLDGPTLKSGKLISMGGFGYGFGFNDTVTPDYGLFGASLKGSVTTKLPFSGVNCP